MAAAVVANGPVEVDTQGNIAPLSFHLDLSCPIALPHRPQSHTWPFSLAGPSALLDDTAIPFVRRRYLETLYLPVFIAPIHHLVEDVSRITPNSAISDAIRPLLLSLPQVQTRHRQTLSPLVTAFLTTPMSATPATSDESAESNTNPGKLSSNERDVIHVAIGLRAGSRAADEGVTVIARTLSDELEKRETMIQVALLFLYIIYMPPTTEVKKRKRDKKKTSVQSVTDDPKASLEVLIDRLSVWFAVAELGEGSNINEEGIQSILKSFWSKVIKPQLPDQCSSFHLKVFAKPLSPSLLPVTTVPVKKSRKPTLTRARPSTDTLTQLPQPVRPPSRPPSESAMSNSLSRDRSLSRSTSALQTTASDLRRSRSTSNDMHRKPSERYTQERAVVRAPSGKDLFKDRQMTFVRRTSSMAKIRESQSLGLGRSQSQAKIGLLGRKTSDPKTRRNSEEGQSQPGTLVFATPSKPRYGRTSQFAAPTPIREEPSSSERPAFVTETPHAARISHNTPGGMFSIAETPVSTRIASLNMFNSRETVEDSGEESDPLGELMVMTDEEDNVPDTPRRG